MLSAAAGVMLAATFFSLLAPALAQSDEITANAPLGVALVGLGVLAGAGGLFAIHRLVPHEHFVLGREGPRGVAVARSWLCIIAITLHDVANGAALAIAIGLENVPEGVAVAISLLSIGYSIGSAFWLATLTGLVGPVGGACGAALVSLADAAMPRVLGMAAGAMLFVISD